MKKLEMTEAIMAAKASSGLGWEEISERVGLSPVFLTLAFLGMNSLKKEYAQKLCDVLKLPEEVSNTLKLFPHKTWESAANAGKVSVRRTLLSSPKRTISG